MENPMISDGWQSCGYLRGWPLYRKVVNGKGQWSIMYKGQKMSISYAQARGYEPLPIPEDRLYGLRKALGGKLLPN